jgi:hypothetical protein
MSDIVTIITKNKPAKRRDGEISTGTGTFINYLSLADENKFTDEELLPSILDIDGAGSGIDADLLDGHHDTYFEPALGTPYATGYILSSDGYGTRSWISKNAVYTPYQTLTDDTTITWNMNNGYNAKVTLGGNRALSITNVANGMSGCLIIKQDSTGNRTITLPAGSLMIDGGIFSLSALANKVDMLIFTYDGTNFLWSIGKNFLGPE